MLLGAALSGLLLVALAVLARRRLGPTLAIVLAALAWSLVVVGLVTLIPAQGAPGVVYADARLPGCSFDVGGPAPQGFWIFGSGQRALNTALFVPSGVLVVLLAGALAERAGRRGRLRSRLLAWTVAPLGLVVLVAYSAGIEVTQLELARLDRACDVTDVIDNATGAGLGVALGLVALGLGALVRAARRM